MHTTRKTILMEVCNYKITKWFLISKMQKLEFKVVEELFSFGGEHIEGVHIGTY